MCATCGCGATVPSCTRMTTARSPARARDPAGDARTVQLQQRCSRRTTASRLNRHRLAERRRMLNLMSSPGVSKTTLLECTARAAANWTSR
jgi:hypothetical protein